MKQICHSGLDPVSPVTKKIPAFAGMTILLLMLITGIASAQFNARDTVSIAASDSASYVYDLGTNKLAAIEFPATFQGGTVWLETAPHRDSTFKVVQYDGSDISLTATDGKQCGVKPVQSNQLLRYIKVISDSTETTGRLLWIIETNF